MEFLGKELFLVVIERLRVHNSIQYTQNLSINQVPDTYLKIVNFTTLLQFFNLKFLNTNKLCRNFEKSKILFLKNYKSLNIKNVLDLFILK